MAYSFIRKDLVQDPQSSKSSGVSCRYGHKTIDIKLLFSSGAKCTIKLNVNEKIISKIKSELIKQNRPIDQLYILYKKTKITPFDTVNSLSILNGEELNVYFKDVSNINSDMLAHCRENKFMVENGKLLTPDILYWGPGNKIYIKE